MYLRILTVVALTPILLAGSAFAQVVSDGTSTSDDSAPTDQSAASDQENTSATDPTVVSDQPDAGIMQVSGSDAPDGADTAETTTADPRLRSFRTFGDPSAASATDAATTNATDPTDTGAVNLTGADAAAAAAASSATANAAETTALPSDGATQTDPVPPEAVPAPTVPTDPVPFDPAAAPTITPAAPVPFDSGSPLSGSGFVSEVQPGDTNVPIGTFNLDASGLNQPLSLNNLPVSITPYNGASYSDLHDCGLYGQDGTPLTTGGNVIADVGNLNTFTFDSPFYVPAGASESLALHCSVLPTALIGSYLLVDVATEAVQETEKAKEQVAATEVAAASNAVVTLPVAPPPQVVSIGNGPPVGALTPTPTTTPTSTPPVQPETTTPPVYYPGIPNTGSGGNAPIVFTILALSGLAALLGFRTAIRPQQ